MGERRERALFAVGVAVLLGAAALSYWLWLGQGSPRPPLPAGQAPAVERLAIVALSGEVRVRRPGSAEAAPARVGDELHSEDVVETGAGGSAQIGAGESYLVGLEESSKFAVREISAELSRFRLAEGLVKARVRDHPARKFEVEAGPGATASTRGADLSVAASETSAAVAVSRGEAQLSSAGRAVVIRGGQRSVAMAGAPPTDPAPIPSSLLLKVAWPEQLATNRRRLVVTGRTEPGALLALDGRPVRVNADGTFRYVVTLQEGRQRLSVTARDAGGLRGHESSPEILLNTRGAPAEFDTRSLWENEGKVPTGSPKPSP